MKLATHYVAWILLCKRRKSAGKSATILKLL